jgi:hypothetical protein
MKELYQYVRILKLQILSSIYKDASVTIPGFLIFLALIMLLVTPLLVAQKNETTTTTTATLFESTNDSFRVQLPEGWVIQDVNNTSSMLLQESTQGYGILAQLCPEGAEGQQQGAVTNISSSSSCQQQQQAQQEIIHVIRYPNLGTRLGITVDDINDIIPDSVLEYQTQKLQEVGYRDINIVRSINTTINIHYTAPENVPVRQATVPARLVEMTYSTSSAPDGLFDSENDRNIRRGYFILTATNVTPPNPETITGYSIFYENGHISEAVIIAGVDKLRPLPRAIGGLFASFELIASEEAVQDILQADI